MKYNQKSQAYSRAVIRKIKQDDFAQLRNIRELLTDIDIYILGMFTKVEEDVVKGDEFDYTQFNRFSRSYFSKLETFINTQYNTIVRLVKKTQKQIYFGYRKDIFDHLKKMGIMPSVLAEADVRVGFGGTPNQSFTQHLLKQTQIGQDPAVLIKTVSQEHVKLIQKQMMMATSKGRGFGWAKDRMMRELYPKVTREALNKTMEYNVTRIMRTSYMRAVNLDTTDFVAQNTEIFYGSRRTADGYPCFGCVMMDGMIYGPGAILEDHPNGQCILVPLVYPDEFLNTGMITKGVKDTFSPSFAERFYAAAEAEQMRMMGNRALFRLWKKDKFDPSFIVNKSGNVFSYRRTVVELPKLGGISNPKVSFLNDGLKKSLSPIMDSKDRLEKGFTVVRRKPVGGMKNGIDLVGDGSDFVGANISNKVKSRIMALYGEEANLPWYRFNIRARELGIFTRKDVNGKLYYIVKDSRLGKQIIKRVVPVVREPITSKEFLKRYKSSSVKGTDMSVKQGVNKVEVIEMENGDKLIRKKVGKEGIKTNELGMEEVYYKLSKDLGMDLVPETACMGKDVVIQKFVSGKTYSELEIMAMFKSSRIDISKVEKAFAKFIKTKEGNDWVLLDILGQTADRHGGNFLIDYKITEKGVLKISKIHLIDNGRAFVGEKLYAAYSPPLGNILRNGNIEKLVLHKKSKENLIKFLEKFEWDATIKKGTVEYKYMWEKMSNNISDYFMKTGRIKELTTYGNVNGIENFIDFLKIVVENDFVIDCSYVV